MFEALAGKACVGNSPFLRSGDDLQDFEEQLTGLILLLYHILPVLEIKIKKIS